MPTMSGSNANIAWFRLSGTNSSDSFRTSVFEIDWDAYPEPPKELYRRTEYWIPDTEVEFLGLNSELDCLSGTVTGIML